MGVSVGTIAALKQNTWIDYTIMSTAMLGVVMPSFVLAPATDLPILASLEHGSQQVVGMAGTFIYLVLPVIGMSLLYVATFARITRG